MQVLEKILEEMDNCIREAEENFRRNEDEKALKLYAFTMSLAKMIVIKHLDAKDNNVPTNARTIPPERGGLKTQ